ncbi:uncharacterized protein EI90DRAFT_3033984 [Cantharellus anzutake]|uniref:uncharacterized protein n=1 Tax=Cantharellus anzutake TaxID=1750568 RepID=UPI00190627AB|nr:uncharacterized protein EI90DRAFT_3033984 [Cantharellus anzutake]KAF8341441.1 hypothetical protein EI90DRAFT_3033984 [Cantharellus anzutake]
MPLVLFNVALSNLVTNLFSILCRDIVLKVLFRNNFALSRGTLLNYSRYECRHAFPAQLPPEFSVVGRTIRAISKSIIIPIDFGHYNLSPIISSRSHMHLKHCQDVVDSDTREIVREFQLSSRK